MNRSIYPVVASCAALLLTAPGSPWAKAEEGPDTGKVETAQASELPGDVIARVGDQTITFGDINTALNSSAIVGVSVPALGTPERDTVRVTLLDRFVSANLLYLDAQKQGIEQDPAYRRAVERFDDAMLAGLFRQRVLLGDVSVSEDEVDAYHKNNFVAGTELTPGLRATIESKIRGEKVTDKLADARAQIRDGVHLKVIEENLDPDGDAERGDDTRVAEIDGEPLTWGAVKEKVIAAGKGAVKADPLAIEELARRNALENEIDLRVMARKARAAGLDQDPLFKARAGEFHKSRLINLHRERLLAQMEPAFEELRAFYEANQGGIAQPEARKIQMVVLKTKDEADAIKVRARSRKDHDVPGGKGPLHRG